MSTAGSAPSSDAPTAAGAAAPRRPRIVRWRAWIVLALVVALLAVLYTLFLDRIVESTVEESATKLLGTAVEVDDLHIHTREAALDIGAVRIADPFDRMQDLVEAGRIRVMLDPEPLLERKIIVRRLEVRDVAFGVRRQSPAPRVAATGFAPRAIRALEQWAAQYRKPILSFTPVDTIRSIVLDPSQLVTVRAATALAARADSLRTATETGLRDLAIPQTLDSAKAVLDRLRGANPAKLGLDGTRRAIADVKRTIDAVNAAKQRLENLARATHSGVALLGSGVRDLDQARQQDYAFARSLLDLPALEGPEISTALFGQVSIDRLQQAMYWAELAREYMPPGLLPREQPGPKRLRWSGTTVSFPREGHAYPSFALQHGVVTFALGEGTGYEARVTGVSSAPALTGEPTRFSVRPTGSGSGSAISFRASGELDHRTSVMRDRALAEASGLPLPGFDLPVLPVRAEPGRGSTELSIALDGSRVDARWTLRSNQVRWVVDSAKLATLNTAESLVYRVLSGLRSLDLTARVAGELRAPNLSVTSNLDRAIGDRLKAVAGEEVARAEAKARAKVDSIVAEKVAPVRAKVTAVQAETQQRVDEARAELDQRKRELEDQLKALTGLPVPKLPF